MAAVHRKRGTNDVSTTAQLIASAARLDTVHTTLDFNPRMLRSRPPNSTNNSSTTVWRALRYKQMHRASECFDCFRPMRWVPRLQERLRSDGSGEANIVTEP